MNKIIVFVSCLFLVGMTQVQADDPTIESLTIQLENMTQNYTALLADYQALQQNYNLLSHEYTILLTNTTEQYNILLLNYSAVLMDYTDLLTAYTTIESEKNAIITELQTNVTSLNSYISLLELNSGLSEGRYANLSGKYDDLLDEKNGIVLERISLTNQLNDPMIHIPWLIIGILAGAVAMIMYTRRNNGVPFGSRPQAPVDPGLETELSKAKQEIEIPTEKTKYWDSPAGMERTELLKKQASEWSKKDK